MTKAARRGRPSKFSEAAAARICEEIALGKSLRALCDEREFPARRTVMTWLSDGKHEGFQRRYAIACELRAELFADEIVELADGATPENVNAVRLQVDTRKWIASRLLPKKYGDRINANVQHGASDDLKAFFDSVSNRSRGLPKHRSTDLPWLEGREAKADKADA